MTLKIRIPRPFFQVARPHPAEVAKLMATATEARPFLTTLVDCAGAHRIDALRHQNVQRVRPPVAMQAPAATSLRPSPLRRVFSWLRGKYSLSATKQLRIAETVSLGEKRFVAIIHADGQKFLIGGGASSVALLTQLGTLAASAEDRAPVMDFKEHLA
jgi:Flagellar biosynthesis protein, FliO